MMTPDSKYGTDTYTVSDLKIFTSLSGTSKKFQKELEEKNVKEAIVINGGLIDVANDYSVKKTKIKNYLDRIVPDPLTKAMIIIDIEGKKMEGLGKEKNSKLFKESLNYYLEVLRFAKKKRPEATIGFYGFPFRDYWNRNEKWRKNNEALLPLLKEVDALFPAIYDFYEDGVGIISKEKDSLYVSDNTVEALRIAAFNNKKVYPLVWHRYHASNKLKGRQLVGKEEFKDHVCAMAAAQYKGKHIDGIVWWSSERYFYNISPRAKQRKASANQDFEKFAEETTTKYLNYLIRGIQEGKVSSQKQQPPKKIGNKQL